MITEWNTIIVSGKDVTRKFSVNHGGGGGKIFMLVTVLVRPGTNCFLVTSLLSSKHTYRGQNKKNSLSHDTN